MGRYPIDLKREQLATLARPRFTYSLAARFFFWSMDLITGKETTFAKLVLLEILASIPYRAWETRQYALLTRSYRRQAVVRSMLRVVAWGREAQDNEYWHLRAAHEKMKEEGQAEPWFLWLPIPYVMVLKYRLFSTILALVSIRSAFLFNAEFEDHAEHVYAQFVADHPELETQPISSDVVKDYRDVRTWADLLRRVSLDERDHRNRSFAYAGRPEHIVRYEGMPETEAL